MRRPLLVVLVAASVLTSALAGAGGNELVEACFRAVNASTDDMTCALCERAAQGSTGADQTVALINLGRCEEGRGRLVAALTAYRRARAAMAADDERTPAVVGRVRALEARVPKLTLDRSQLPEDASVSIDGAPTAVGEGAVEVDAGPHEIVVTAPLREDNLLTVTLIEGQGATVVLVAGRARSQPGRGTGLHPQAIAGIAVGVVGVLGWVGFGVTGGLALDRQSTFDERCPPVDGGVRPCSDAAALDAASEGRTLNIVNAVSLVVGVAGVATGLTLWLTAPDDEPPGASLRLRLSPGFVGLSGSF